MPASDSVYRMLFSTHSIVTKCLSVGSKRLSTTAPVYTQPLRGKNVFITGASSGIGRACATKFAEAGSNIIISARRAGRLEALRSQIKKDHSECLVHAQTLDVTDRSSVNNFVRSIPDELRNIDVLVCNAGLVLGLDPLLDVKPEHMDTMLDTNVKGLVYCIQAMLPQMIEKGGHIVNLGSIAGNESDRNMPGYELLHMSTRTSQDHYMHPTRLDTNKEYVCLCTLVSTGMVETEFSKVRFHGDEVAAKSVYKGITPLTAEDIADLIVFATSRPSHVEIADMVVFPHGQATATLSHRKST
ncbi:hypothetical protein H4219_000768 [Mycoemilia scoparia]|uniref:Uncharacterized protein n=1 Tax=Mycoemilia scoparia TaxID=417184 RepID=A0A9W8AB29_9FUNG|nr:hypothetical protein H4219_000768 [Mycoemilia scoparia]